MLAVILALACAACVLVCATGCRASDALKEIVYDQTSENIDYDNPNKYLINDSQATEKSDAVPAHETSDTAQTTEQRQNLVVYNSKPNSPKFRAKQSLWDPKPDFKGLEASSKVNFVETDDPNATEQNIGTKKQDRQDNPTENADLTQNTDSGEEGLGEGAGTGDAESNTSKNTKNKDSSKGANNGGKEKTPGNGINGTVDVDLTDEFSKVPEIDSIAAYGSLATLVQMIGGQGALAAADETLLKGAFKDVFKDEGSSSIKKGWSGDGSDSAKMDVDAIISSGAGAVLVYENNYVSKKDKTKLEKKKIQVIKVFRLTCSKYILSDATTIGKLLKSSSKRKSTWSTTGKASDYKTFHNDLVNACIKNNGGLAGSQVYEKHNSAKNFNKDAKYTLLLDEYDTSAYYKASIDGWTANHGGVALSTVGYSSTPVSYYMQAGGLVNNAAAKGGGESGQIPAWQFNGSIASFTKSKWSYASGGAMANSLDFSRNSASGWNKTLFTAASSSSGASTVTKCFGSDVFPKLVAGTQQVKSKLIAESKQPDGIYRAYGHQSKTTAGATFSGYGLFTSGGTLLYSSIGVDSENSKSAFEGAIPDERVLVNPTGLFASWTKASPEAVLEAAWVNDVANGAGSAVDWKKQVKDFYDKFYRHDLSNSELAFIEAGAEK